MVEQRKRFRWPGLSILDEAREILDRVPSEESMNRFLDELPRLERMVNKLEELPKLSSLADAFEDGTIRRLLAFLPILEGVPKERTLANIADMKPYLERLPSPSDVRHLVELLERLPEGERLEELISLLRDVRGFMAALKGVS